VFDATATAIVLMAECVMEQPGASKALFCVVMWTPTTGAPTHPLICVLTALLGSTNRTQWRRPTLVFHVNLDLSSNQVLLPVRNVHKACIVRPRMPLVSSVLVEDGSRIQKKRALFAAVVCTNLRATNSMRNANDVKQDQSTS
tara:strand:- start:56 stop:484 length:429 start_codon:yes stop_codon:yes gene_type:complete